MINKTRSERMKKQSLPALLKIAAAGSLSAAAAQYEITRRAKA